VVPRLVHCFSLTTTMITYVLWTDEGKCQSLLLEVGEREGEGDERGKGKRGGGGSGVKGTWGEGGSGDKWGGLGTSEWEGRWVRGGWVRGSGDEWRGGGTSEREVGWVRERGDEWGGGGTRGKSQCTTSTGTAYSLKLAVRGSWVSCNSRDMKSMELGWNSSMVG